MSGDDKPRRYIQGADTRDDLGLAARRARTNAGQFDLPPDEFDSYTPPPVNVVDRDRELWRLTKEVQHRQRRESEARQSARAQQANQIGELLARTEKLNERVVTLEGDRDEFAGLRIAATAANDFRLDLCGKSGTNGRVGRLTDRVASLEAHNERTHKDRIILAGKAFGLLAGIIAAVGSYFTLRADVAHLTETVERNQTRIEQIREKNYDPTPPPTIP